MSQTELISYAIAGVGAITFIAGIATFAKGKKGSSSDGFNKFVLDSVNFGSVQEYLAGALERLMAETGATDGYILLADDDHQYLLPEVARSKSTIVFADALPVSAGISGQSFTKNQRLVVNKAKKLTLCTTEFGVEVQAAVSVPIVTYDSANHNSALQTPIGTLTLVKTQKGGHFSSADLEQISAYAICCSTAVANLKLQEFGRQTILLSLQEISDLIEAKDPHTTGHCYRTSIVAHKIAETLGLDATVVSELTAGARLIDIGKIAIPDSIIRKTSALTTEEFALVQEHPLVSYNICKKLNLSESLLLFVRNHHEKLDGSGYPDGLRGGELPMPLRVVCIADAYDAMRCPRHHRAGLSHEEAIQQLVMDAGTKFDPNAVEALRQVAESGELDTIYEGFTAWAQTA